MVLALGIALKFYSSVEKTFKLKVTKILGIIATFVEVTGEKVVGGGGSSCLSWIGLTRITRIRQSSWRKIVTDLLKKPVSGNLREYLSEAAIHRCSQT